MRGRGKRAKANSSHFQRSFRGARAAGCTPASSTLHCTGGHGVLCGTHGCVGTACAQLAGLLLSFFIKRCTQGTGEISGESLGGGHSRALCRVLAGERPVWPRRAKLTCAGSRQKKTGKHLPSSDRSLTWAFGKVEAQPNQRALCHGATSAAVPGEEKQTAAFIRARQSPLLSGISEGPMWCSRWGGLRHRPPGEGQGGDVSTPSLSHRSAKAGPGDKSGTGLAGGWGAHSLQRGVPCPARGCTRTKDRQAMSVQPHGEIRSRECLVLILSVSAISQSAAIVYRGILCSTHK